MRPEEDMTPSLVHALHWCERLERERDEARAALADLVQILDKYDNAPVSASNAIDRAREVLAA